jgi:SH3-like domain-containing protein
MSRIFVYRHIVRDFFIAFMLLFSLTSLVTAAERYAVTAKIANIRSGPGTNHSILFEAEQYYPLKVLKKSGNWFQVEDFEGDVGWIYKKLVKGVTTVITKKPKCNIRTGPSIKNQVVYISERGVPFLVLGKEGKWIHIRHADGYEGWIHSSLVW